MKQIKVIIQGVELDAALLNPTVARRFEDGIKEVANKANLANALANGADAIEAQCDAVMKFVDYVFGAGSARKVFGEETDLLTCLDAFEELASLYEKQVNPIIKGYTDRAESFMKGL